MNNNDILMSLRKKMIDAINVGMVDKNSGGILETVLIQIVNEAERNKQRCDQIVIDSKRQTAQAEAQSNAYTQIQSIVYAVLNGFVNNTVAAIQAEKEKQAEVEELSNEETKALEELAKQQELEQQEKENSRRKKGK